MLVGLLNNLLGLLNNDSVYVCPIAGGAIACAHVTGLSAGVRDMEDGEGGMARGWRVWLERVAGEGG